MTQRISIIIPAVNEAAAIERAVRSAWDAGADEVVMVDGGSDDDTAQRATANGATVVSGPRGRAVQQNLGAGHATGDVLWFLHADNWLAAEAGIQLRDALGDAQVLAGAFRQQIDANGAFYRLLEYGNAARARWRGLAYGDQAIFMRRDVFNQLGRFPDLPLMEDLRLMRRFRERGKAVLLPGPVHVDPRRWQRRGALRQTLSNWSLLAAEATGVSPDRLARFYPRHDQPTTADNHTTRASRPTVPSADR